MKRIVLFFSCTVLMFLLSSCALAGNPLERAEATPVPGLPMKLHSATASDENADKMEIALFYRYEQSDMLSSETRTVTVPRDESPEMIAVRQLLAGPQASHTELKRLFPHNTTVLDVHSTDDTLFITLSEDLLNDGIPEEWNKDPIWKTEAPLRRKLTMQSLVATITENFSYPYVQVMLSANQLHDVSTRLDNSYFLDGRTGLADRLIRDESLLLTMQNTAMTLLKAWQVHDYELLYQFTAPSHAQKPSYSDFIEALEECATLTAYSASAGYSSANGKRATVTLDITYRVDEREYHCPAYPLWLVRDNDLWKVPYEELQQMMLRDH